MRTAGKPKPRARSRGAPRPRLRRGSTICFDGDSNTNRRCPPSLDTWPYLQLMHWHLTWADEVGRLMWCWRPDLRLNFHNAAVGGSILRDLVARASTVVLPHRPTLVLATIGGNDAARRIPLAEFARDARAYVELVASVGGRVAWIANFPGVAGPLPKVDPYRRVLRAVAAESGGWYVDVGRPFARAIRELEAQWADHTVFADGDHFNAVGNAIIAGEVLRFLGER